MSRVSDRQLVALIERRNLDPSDPKFISEEVVQSLLDNHLVPRDAAGAAVVVGGDMILDIAPLVEKMIKAGIHKVTDNGKGMTAKAYKKLWPKTVTQPAGYVGRFDQALLVDTKVKLADLVQHGRVVVYTEPSACKDLVPAPTGENGMRLTRYVAFFQDGAKNKDRTVEGCRASFVPDEVGLVTREGLHLPIQHVSSLRDHVVNLPGSHRHEAWDAPSVNWFDSDQPKFDVYHVQYRRPYFGSASRGSVVIPVT